MRRTIGNESKDEMPEGQGRPLTVRKGMIGMMHSPHQGRAMIFHDDCMECIARSGDLQLMHAMLDRENGRLLARLVLMTIQGQELPDSMSLADYRAVKLVREAYDFMEKIGLLP